MDYRELWTDPDFLAMVIEYVDAHVSKYGSLDFDPAYQDPLKLAAEAHKIAGSAGMYGFPDVGDTARSLEVSIRENGTRDEALSLFEDLKCRIAQAAEELAAFRAEVEG